MGKWERYPARGTTGIPGESAAASDEVKREIVEEVLADLEAGLITSEEAREILRELGVEPVIPPDLPIIRPEPVPRPEPPEPVCTHMVPVLYVATEEGELLMLDPLTGEEQKAWDADEGGSGGRNVKLTFDAQRQVLYLADEGSGEMSVFDALTQTLQPFAATVHEPLRILADVERDVLYVLDHGTSNDTILLFSASTGDFIGSQDFPAGTIAEDMTLDAVTGDVYFVTNEGVSQLTADSHTLAAIIASGSNYTRVAIDAVNRTLFAYTPIVGPPSGLTYMYSLIPEDNYSNNFIFPPAVGIREAAVNMIYDDALEYIIVVRSTNIWVYIQPQNFDNATTPNFFVTVPASDAYSYGQALDAENRLFYTLNTANQVIAYDTETFAPVFTTQLDSLGTDLVLGTTCDEWEEV